MTSLPKQRIALALFGCFNPPTFQHLRLFELARDWLHKLGGYEKLVIGYVLNEWETKQKDWTLTNTVLNRLQSELDIEYKDNLPIPKVALLCGADLLQSFSIPGLWATKDVDEILEKFGIVVISREEIDADKIVYENDQLSAWYSRIVFVKEWVRHDLSSTKIRRCVKRGESIKYLTSDSVIAYIKEHGLYI